MVTGDERLYTSRASVLAGPLLAAPTTSKLSHDGLALPVVLLIRAIRQASGEPTPDLRQLEAGHTTRETWGSLMVI